MHNTNECHHRESSLDNPLDLGMLQIQHAENYKVETAIAKEAWEWIKYDHTTH